MSGCCDPSGYERMFGAKTAKGYVRGFTRKGLDATAKPMVEALKQRGLDGCSVLDIGAGSGSALVSMLEAGAVVGTGIDISPAYEPVALDLLDGRGHRDSVTWITGDFVALADEVPVADAVFGNRVVCCYPFMEEMVDAAVSKAGRYLALAYPRDTFLARLVTRFINLLMRIRSNSFRTFVHDPKAIAERIERAGFIEAAAGKTPQWHWFVWEARAA